MGRVARYKKIKSFDPYSKQNGGRIADSLESVGIWGLGDNGRRTKKRSKTAEALHQRKVKRRRAAATAKGKQLNNDDDLDDKHAFDLPPGKEDDFDLEDMVGSIKKETLPSLLADPSIRPLGRTVQLPEGLQATIPETEREEKKMAKLLNIKPDQVLAEHNDKKNSKAPAGRMEGESKRAYNKRVKNETRQIIRREVMDRNNPEKRKRKNEFLTEKKNKKRKSNQNNSSNNRDDGGDNDDRGRKRYDVDDLVTGERAAAAAQDVVRFGEQAERPPEFRQLPRGSKNSPKGASKNSKPSSKTKGMGLNEQQIAAEQVAMENLRRKVQAQYAVIKMKRKQAGDFHL